MEKKKSHTNYETEKWASRILKLGIWTSGIFMIAGLVLASLFPSSVEMNLENPKLDVLIKNIFSGNPFTLMFIGLVLLMTTPILRVFIALIGFAFERDWRFSLVSLIVFIMLVGEIIYSIMIS